MEQKNITESAPSKGKFFDVAIAATVAGALFMLYSKVASCQQRITEVEREIDDFKLTASLQNLSRFVSVPEERVEEEKVEEERVEEEKVEEEKVEEERVEEVEERVEEERVEEVEERVEEEEEERPPPVRRKTKSK